MVVKFQENVDLIIAVEYIKTTSFPERKFVGFLCNSSSRKIACSIYKEHSTPTGSLSTLELSFQSFVKNLEIYLMMQML